MGTFFHPIIIIGPRGQKTLDALVEPNHLFALIPYAVLSRLDFWPDRSKRYRGEWRGFGQVQGELMGQRSWITYLVAADDELPRIGSHTLDSFLLDVDEEHGKLVPKTLRVIEHAR